jgi:hypothetical protein
MSRKSVLTGLVVAIAVLAGTMAAAASVFDRGVCKPVKVCEKVQPVPVCQPVTSVPTCGPVKVCERVDGHMHHVAARARTAHVLTPKKRVVTNYRGHHGYGYQVVPAAPKSATPSEKRPELAPAPQPPVPPSPVRT